MIPALLLACSTPSPDTAAPDTVSEPPEGWVVGEEEVCEAPLPGGTTEVLDGPLSPRRRLNYAP